jgi:hypothetical protein
LKKTFKPLLNHLSDGYKRYLRVLDKWLENVTRYFLGQLMKYKQSSVVCASLLLLLDDDSTK